MGNVAKVAVAVAVVVVVAAITANAATTFLATVTKSAKIGYVKTVPSFLVPVFALEKGFFDAEALKVEAVAFESPGKVAEALRTGDIEFGAVSTSQLDIFAPATQGFYHKLVHFGVTFGVVDGQLYRAWDVVVRSDLRGKVNTYKDLEGLKVGVGGPALLRVTLSQAMATEGGNSKKVVWVEKPLAEMPGALASGVVDAFIGPTSQATARVILDGKAFSLGDPYLVVMPGVLGSAAGWYTTEDYLKNDPDVVKRFQRAVDRAVSHIKDRPEEWKEWVSKTTGLPREVVNLVFKEVLIERYASHPAMGRRGIAGLKAWAKLGRDAKLFSGEVDVERILVLPWDDPWK